ncbi:MAG: hypothetical protein WCI51_15250 [Lentisphaerota bacterium]
MRYFIMSGLIVFLALSAGMNLAAATITYKANNASEPQKLTKVKIISIIKGVMTIERDGAKRSISLSQLVDYSDSDITGGDSFDDNSADYTVTLIKVDMPKNGLIKNGVKSSSNPADCEVEYTINRKSSEGKDIDRIKAPYFYLYVMAEGNDEYNNHNTFRFCYPAEAKPGSDTYDESRILTAVQSLKRHTINLEDSRGLSTSKKSGMGLGDRQVKIKLAKIGDHKIVAYHLEVWGKSEKIVEKDWNEPGYAKDKKWWLRY